MMSSRKFRVRTVKHPIFWVADLDDAAGWFERVFGRPTITTEQIMGHLPPKPGHRVDYGIFHLVQDTFIESIDPVRMVFGGTNQFPRRGIPPADVPSLGHLSWYVDDVHELLEEFLRRDMQVIDQQGEVTTEVAFGGKIGFPLFYSLREQAGLPYQYVDCPPSEENARKTADVRLKPGWALAPPAEDDPLGIEFCSHHTVLTTRPDRMLELYVDILGGRVIERRDNELIGAESTFIALGDGVYECAVPREGTAVVAGSVNPDPYDSYHSMTFLVRDLARAEAHLEEQGVAIARRSDTALVTDPASSYGVPWGFTTALAHGDQRAAVDPSASTTGGSDRAH